MLKVSRFEFESSGFGESKLSSRHVMISTQMSCWLHAHIRGLIGRAKSKNDYVSANRSENFR